MVDNCAMLWMWLVTVYMRHARDHVYSSEKRFFQNVFMGQLFGTFIGLK